MNKIYPFAAALGLTALTLSGCGKEATGQVAAVVNGEEITLQEVNAELQAANLPEGVNQEAAQQAALSRIVDRRLMAQVAREDGLDQTPDYLLRKRQLEEALLLQLMTQKIDQTTEVPDQATIDKYIEDNPAIFEERTLYTLDRIQFPGLEDMSRLKILEDDMSMPEVIESLNQLGIQFQRGEVQLDTGQVGQARIDSIKAVPDGEPFVVVENGMVYVADIISARATPVPEEQRQPLAVAALRRQSLAKALQTRLDTTKGGAEISYQEGFSPPSEKTDGSELINEEVLESEAQ